MHPHPDSPAAKDSAQPLKRTLFQRAGLAVPGALRAIAMQEVRS